MSVYCCCVLNTEKTESCEQIDCQYYGKRAINHCIALVSTSPKMKDIAFFKGISEEALKKERASTARNIRHAAVLLAYSRFCTVENDTTSTVFESVKARSPYSADSAGLWVGDSTFRKMLSEATWIEFQSTHADAKWQGYLLNQVLFLTKQEWLSYQEQ